MILALAKAGINHTVTVHGLRRTFNNLLGQVATGVVRSMTGHPGEEMTDHYSWVNATEKREAVLRLASLLPAAVKSGTESGAGSPEPSDEEALRYAESP